MNIRQATTADVAGLTSFGRRVLDETYLRTGWLAADEIAEMFDWWAPEYFAEALEGPHVILVAENHDGIIGATQTEILEPPRAVMWKLYVDRRHQARGIGSALVDATMAALPDSVVTWQTEYLATNEPAARFYHSRGFQFDHDESYDRRIYRWVSRSLPG
ncbi:MAG: GNAT family N-acetyltransferase [Acidimicrobiia bacterium]